MKKLFIAKFITVLLFIFSINVTELKANDWELNHSYSYINSEGHLIHGFDAFY